MQGKGGFRRAESGLGSSWLSIVVRRIQVGGMKEAKDRMWHWGLILKKLKLSHNFSGFLRENFSYVDRILNRDFIHSANSHDMVDLMRICDCLVVPPLHLSGS